MFSRIANQLQQVTNEKFCILFGNGVDDCFLTDQGIEFDLHRSLQEELKSLGYEHIVFSAPHKALFYLDAEPEEISSAPVVEKKNLPKRRQVLTNLSGVVRESLEERVWQWISTLSTYYSTIGLRTARAIPHT